MNKKVLVPLAQGVEELEAVSIIDILRRAGIDVVTAGLDEGIVTGSRGTRLLPDMTLDEALAQEFDLVALPGGLPGSDHLAGDERINQLLRAMNESGRYVGAICAAPKVLARNGVLKGRNATAYPGILQEEAHEFISAEPVIRDGTVITSRSVGTAMDFALLLVEILAGAEKRRSVEDAMERA